MHTVNMSLFYCARQQALILWCVLRYSGLPEVSSQDGSFTSLPASVNKIKYMSWDKKYSKKQWTLKKREVLSDSYEKRRAKICCSPPVESIMRLMTIWRITGTIIRTAIIVAYAQLWSAVLTILGLGHFFWLFCVL